METERINKVVVDEERKDVGVGGSRKVSYTDLFIRFLALMLSLAAAIILGLDKQTKIVPITVVSSLPPLYVPVTAKFHYLSAFTYVFNFSLSFHSLYCFFWYVTHLSFDSTMRQ